MEDLYLYILLPIGAALITGLIMLLVQKKKMHTVSREYYAKNYLTGVFFANVSDIYLKTTETRRYSPQEKKNN